MYAMVSRYTVLRAAGTGTSSRTWLPWPDINSINSINSISMGRSYAVTDPEGISTSGRTEETRSFSHRDSHCESLCEKEKEHTMLLPANQASIE